MTGEVALGHGGGARRRDSGKGSWDRFLPWAHRTLIDAGGAAQDPVVTEVDEMC